MIQSITIRNFQSLSRVDLELSPFTVIVGPSSSGKSAFMRAMRTLTSNRRGAEFISHGERTAVISAVTDRGTVTLTRSKGQTDNTYRVIPSDPGHPLAPERTFEKLGGETPPEVSDFIGIEARNPLNYAGQFDMPFMLGPSMGAESARVLGSLTNVDLIFEGARESNRRKLAAVQQLKVRSEDLSDIRKKIPEYRSLKQQLAALELAGSHLAAARDIEKQLVRLSAAVEQLAAAEAALEPLQERAERPVPSDEGILEAAGRLTRLTGALKAVSSARSTLQEAEAVLEAHSARAEEAQVAYDEVIGEVGDNLAGWIAATARPGSITSKFFEDKAGGFKVIELDEAIRVFTLYLETTTAND